jgi:hypothetical protein
VGSARGGKTGPQGPLTWVDKRGWRLAVLRGIAVAGEGQHLFSLYPIATGHCEMGALRQLLRGRLGPGAASLAMTAAH